WNTITVKYGRRLRQLFALPDGDALQRRLDDMANEEYQRILRSPANEVRDRLCDEPSTRAPLRRLLDGMSDEGIALAVRDLGGHDLVDLRDALRQADATRDQPT